MTQGILTYVPATQKLMLTPDGAGGVFLQVLTFNSTDHTTIQQFSIPDAADMEIFGIMMSGGYHEAVFDNSTNPPRVYSYGYNKTLWANYTPPGGFNTTYAVFAK